jgi:phage terminase small subunit
MPRKSIAAQSMANLAVDGRPERLKPPAGLSPRERALFNHIVNSLPPEHFRPSDMTLVARFVESAALAEKAAVELRKGAVIDGKASPWLVVQEKCIRAVTALAARLRLSPQSRLDQRSAAREQVPYRRPWLIGADDEEEGVTANGS